jgi:hypothetical protein
VFWNHLPNINKDCDRTSLQIAEGINAEGLSRRCGKNLDRRLIQGMKTIVASLEAGVKLGVYGFNVLANPTADGSTVGLVNDQTNDVRF